MKTIGVHNNTKNNRNKMLDGKVQNPKVPVGKNP